MVALSGPRGKQITLRGKMGDRVDESDRGGQNRLRSAEQDRRSTARCTFLATVLTDPQQRFFMLVLVEVDTSS